MDTHDDTIRSTVVQMLEARGFERGDIRDVQCKTKRKSSAVRWAVLATRPNDRQTRSPRSAHENTLVVRLADHVTCKLN